MYETVGWDSDGIISDDGDNSSPKRLRAFEVSKLGFMGHRNGEMFQLMMRASRFLVLSGNSVIMTAKLTDDVLASKRKKLRLHHRRSILTEKTRDYGMGNLNIEPPL